MAYLSLYRRYRPQTFADVIGQDHVTRTLSNAIAEDRLHHAYLFTGPRGTGKTSIARILAKAINCEAGPSPSPCNTCSMCVEITEGSSVDVIELDMASHGGVDDARELRDRAMFGPGRARRKVYILDEVHMASTAAFNALLKLIEEPPPHVLFAMATTDPQKVLPTILSRVQRLDLRRVDAEVVATQIKTVTAAEGFTIDDDAVEVIVRAGDGSVRDTLSILEQVLAFAGDHVDGTSVAQVLGSTPHERAAAVVDGIVSGDVGALLVAVQALVDDGHDLRRFTLDLAQHVRDLLALSVAPDRPDLVDGTQARRSQLEQQAATTSASRLLAIIRELSTAIAEQRQASPRLALELALSTLAVTGPGSVPAPVADGSQDVEMTSASLGAAPPASDRAASPVVEIESDATEVTAASGVEEADVEQPVVEEPEVEQVSAEEPVLAVAEPIEGETSASDDDLEVIRREWDGILDLLKARSRRCHALFEPAKPLRVADGVLTLRYGKRYVSFHAAQAQKAEFTGAFLAAVQEQTGQTFKLDILREGQDERRRPRPESVTPDDARTPVFDRDEAPEASATEDDGASNGDDDPEADEVAAVREAETAPPAPAVDIDALLEAELGAARLDEDPPRQV